MEQETKRAEPTKEQFAAYVKVQQSGVTNMFFVTVVGQLSGLDRDTVIEIQKRYEELAERFPDVVAR